MKQFFLQASTEAILYRLALYESAWLQLSTQGALGAFGPLKKVASLRAQGALGAFGPLEKVASLRAQGALGALKKIVSLQARWAP